jgi:pteridine reductase
MDNPWSLHGKTALVTGAGRRLGRDIAVALAEGGADVVLHVHTSSGEDVARAITALGRRVHVIAADLATTTGTLQLSRDALTTAGVVDILINNAAVFFPTPLDALTVDAWRSVLRTNLTAPFLLALFLGRAMKERGRGKIIQLGDWSGRRPVPSYLAYCVSKSGVAALTQALAKALAPQVQVNAVAPGPVLPPEHYDETARRTLIRQTPLQRMGSAQDVVRTVRFLAESAGFVTGAIYIVDGGWSVQVVSGNGTSL